MISVSREIHDKGGTRRKGKVNPVRWDNKVLGEVALGKRLNVFTLGKSKETGVDGKCKTMEHSKAGVIPFWWSWLS